MGIRTDLALESEALQRGTPNGVRQSVTMSNHVQITTIQIENESGAKAIGRPIGTYITLKTPRLLSPEELDFEQNLLSCSLKKLLPKKGTVLAVGIGNSSITPDAIGPKCAKQILATRHFQGTLAESLGLSGLRPVAVMSPGVLGQTGMESHEILQALCASLQPETVIVIDALAARDVKRLGTTVQIGNSGISPGSGVENRRMEISKRTLGVPVIAIGVPTVVDMDTLAEDLCHKPQKSQNQAMMVTPRDIDRLVDKSATLLAGGINQALFPELSREELRALSAS